MRGKGWHVGAACMERWFHSPGRQMPLEERNGAVDFRQVSARYIDAHLIKMDWAFRFPRVFSVAYRLQREWVTEAASRNLRARLATWRAAHRITSEEFRFGDLSRPAVILNETCQANSRSVGSPYDPFDDFYAALGRATMNLAVQGSFKQTSGGRGVLTVDGMAVCLRDSYDFNGDQPLGYWNRAGVSSIGIGAQDIPVRPPTGANDADWSFGIGKLRVEGATRFVVENASFRNYRRLTHQGGDFSIFSDVHRLPMPPRLIEILI